MGVDREDHMYCLCFEAFKKENSKENDMQAQAEHILIFESKRIRVSLTTYSRLERSERQNLLTVGTHR